MAAYASPEKQQHQFVGNFMATPIKFYFDFVSAYSYVAMNRIDRIAKRYGREVEWNCVSLPAVLAHHK